jgi:hypothetical protein
MTSCGTPSGSASGVATNAPSGAGASAAGRPFEYQGTTFTLRADRPPGWVPLTQRENAVELASETEIRLSVAGVVGTIAYPPPSPPPSVDEEIATVEQAVEYVSTHPALEVSEPEDVTVGGLPGQQLDVTSSGEVVPLFIASSDEDEPELGQSGTQSDRYIFLQLTDDQVVLVDIYDARGERDADAVMSEAQPLVDALEIEPAGS